MNLQELAKKAGVSRTTISAWISKGCPHERDKQGRYTFNLEAVTRWRADTMPTKSPVASVSYSDARARKETALAGLRELQLRERTGELVERAAVADVQFKLGRQIRDAFLNVPDRVAGILAAETDQHRIHTILTKEILQVLGDLSDTKDTPTTTA